MRSEVALRLSGLVATAVFLLMVASDLLMLTTLDFSQPYGFWKDAPSLPQTRVTLGYYLGELTIPFYLVSAWHLSLAARPAGLLASRLVLVTMAYGTCIMMVWHASFAFTRSILRAEIAAGSAAGAPSPEALFAFETYALPLFRVGLAAAGLAFLFVFGLALLGRTLYPRWAGLVFPATYVAVAFLLGPYVSIGAAVVLRAAGWNVGGAVLMALSTALLWKKPGAER